MKALQFPLTKITLAFVLGIYYMHYTSNNTYVLSTLTVIMFSLFGIAYFYSFRHFLQKMIFGLLTTMVAFLLGTMTLTLHSLNTNRHHYSSHINPERKQQIEVCISEKLKSTSFGYRYIVNVNRINGIAVNGKLLLQIIKKEGNPKKIQIGSNLQIIATIRKHRKPLNPDQFDYGAYLLNKSIAAQIQVGISDIKISTLIKKDIYYYADKIRSRILTNLHTDQFTKDEINVAAALLLGQQQDIDPVILQNYQLAGAIHVLSVSGLHIGFIVFFLDFLLGRVPRNSIGLLIRTITTLLSLWAFAVIAGLSPSILRAVAMFSFLTIGLYLRRETYIFHTLFASLLTILIFSPNFLFDVGFQLSYLSLFFILWLQPLFAVLWMPENRIYKYLWNIFTVSIAAQIGAFPLSIYYFHQFSGLFLITNMIILPGLGIIMILGCILLLLAIVDLVPLFAAKFLALLIYMLDTVIASIASFDSFIINDIPLTKGMLLSLYLFIIAVIFLFSKPRTPNLIFALASMLLFQSITICTIWSKQQQNETVVFHTNRNTLITYRNGRQLIVYTNCSTNTTTALIKPYQIANFTTARSNKNLSEILYLNGKKILILDSNVVYPPQLRPDIIVLTQSPPINLQRLITQCKPGLILADGSNYKYLLPLWSKTCLKQKIPFHATAEKGFYKIE